MKATLTKAAMLAIAVTLAACYATYAAPVSPEHRSDGAVTPARAAPEPHSIKVAPSRAKGEAEFPEVRVTASRMRLGIPFFRGVRTCDACPTCKISDGPDWRWQLAARRPRDDRRMLLPAVILTRDNGKLVVHWRRLVAASPEL
jgi:hypothetical protein